ncbi:hypothetical protein CW751_04850 [Brumimicrobium salinarum]|uniref:Uncharacterized protein n=1 Tax=Brumimicrobium salinarum TaxID=2058658 RepID=A0A2I0R486_9FLAO|nr:hypothetical protein [Brumimicrobium salinarum]PKR81388.1 hypothetical protein CW751_04850 [Brumimicrobium salinarum]
MKTILKDNAVFMLFFTGLACIHFGVYQLFPELYFGDEIILSYAVLFILNSIGATIFFLGNSGSFKIDFAQLFLVFTTLQMLGSFAFAAYIKLSYIENTKPALMQFVVLFMITLVFQTTYFVKTKIKS